MSSKSVHGREAKSLKNGIPTLCKVLQFNSSASPCRPPKQTNKQSYLLIKVGFKAYTSIQSFENNAPPIVSLFVLVDGKVKQMN